MMVTSSLNNTQFRTTNGGLPPRISPSSRFISETVARTSSSIATRSSNSPILNLRDREILPFKAATPRSLFSEPSCSTLPSLRHFYILKGQRLWSSVLFCFGGPRKRVRKRLIARWGDGTA